MSLWLGVVKAGVRAARCIIRPVLELARGRSKPSNFANRRLGARSRATTPYPIRQADRRDVVGRAACPSPPVPMTREVAHLSRRKWRGSECGQDADFFGLWPSPVQALSIPAIIRRWTIGIGKRARRTAPVGENRVKCLAFFTRGVSSNQASTVSERRFEITPRGDTSEPSISTTKLLLAVSPFAHAMLSKKQAIGPLPFPRNTHL